MPRETSPAISLNRDKIARIFYEMHACCEHRLSLSGHEKHLIALGYMLYASRDGSLMATSLRAASPTLLNAIYQAMHKVSEQALLILAGQATPADHKKLCEFDRTSRLIKSCLRELQST